MWNQVNVRQLLYILAETMVKDINNTTILFYYYFFFYHFVLLLLEIADVLEYLLIQPVCCVTLANFKSTRARAVNANVLHNKLTNLNENQTIYSVLIFGGN